MGGAGVTRRPLAWVLLLLGWVVLARPSGLVLYAVTTFLFAFSGGQYRMVPVVGAGPWVVSVGALLVGGGVLAATRSLPRALGAVLGSIVVAWPVVVVILWVVSYRLGLHPPRFGLSPPGLAPVRLPRRGRAGADGTARREEGGDGGRGGAQG